MFPRTTQHNTTQHRKIRQRKPTLELSWIGKYDEPKPIEPRILIEVPELSYHASKRYSKNDIFDNRLIFGDNLLALKALEQEFTGKIKCIYIDPPYNTGSAFEHYDDGLENSVWLSLMYARVQILWNLLSHDGFLAIQIDDNQFARLYLLLTEICGENNIKVIVVKMSEPTGVKMAHVRKAGSLAKLKEYIILCGKQGIRNLHVQDIPKKDWDDEYNRIITNLPKGEIDKIRFLLSNDDSSENTISLLDNLVKTIQFDTVASFAKKETGKAPTLEWKQNNSWRIIRTCATTESVKNYADAKRQYLSSEISSFVVKTPQGRKYLVLRNYDSTSPQPRIKVLFAQDYLTYHPGDFWDDIKTTGLGNEGMVDFTNGKKPEELVGRIITMCSDEGDLVLDSFLGSGTTAAVAHKLRRRWIGIELGNHCYTHCIPRIKRVISGEDQGGVSKRYAWQGGGGFRFYRLAPSLVINNPWGIPTVNPEYNGEMLAEALCKLDGYTFDPNRDVFWQQGHGTENCYLYATTQTMTTSMLEYLSEKVGGERFLIVYCGAYEGNAEQFTNLSVRKIPKEILKRCEWNHDDYSLQIENLPQAESLVPDKLPKKKNGSKKAKYNSDQRLLFDAEGEEEGVEE